MGQHLRHHVHHNSVLSYEQFAEILDARRRQVVDHYRSSGPSTDRETMTALGFVDMNSVRWAVTRMVQAGVLEETSSRLDPLTNRTVRVVSYVPLPSERQQQLEEA